MRYTLLISFVLLGALLTNAQTAVSRLADINWLAGCWERNDKSKSLLISEQWMAPAGGLMIGMGRTVKSGKTTGWEYMRIEQRADGIYFVSKPKENAEETAFKLIRSTKNEVVFENKDHDFPQRVIYKLQGTKMTGRIEGNNSGEFMYFDFPMNKVKCG